MSQTVDTNKSREFIKEMDIISAALNISKDIEWVLFWRLCFEKDVPANTLST